MLPSTDDLGRFAPGERLITNDGRELVVVSSQPYRDRGLLVRYEGCERRTDAEALRGLSLTISASERRSLEDGEYWEDDLVGLTALDPNGVVLGKVARLEYGPGQDRLVVSTSNEVEVLVPFVSDIVDDPSGDGTIVINAPEGLFE